MIQMLKENNPSALFAENWNFDIIKRIYPYANISQRLLLYEMVENSEWKSILDAISTEPKKISILTSISVYFDLLNTKGFLL